MTTNEHAPAMRPCRNCKGTGSVGWFRSVGPGKTERDGRMGPQSSDADGGKLTSGNLVIFDQV